MFILLSYLAWGVAALAGAGCLLRAGPVPDPHRARPWWLPLRGRWLRFLLAGILVVYGLFLLAGGFGMLFLGYDPWNAGT
jgi:hypothetical protein